MNIRFWGVRGSIPSPGPSTTRYGGNTMCLSVRLDAQNTLVLDAGTGLYPFGQAAENEPHTYYVLLSHVHWDHINGFPMFHPLMNPDASIRVLTEMNLDWGDQFLGQLDGVHFPISIDDVKATVSLCPSVKREMEQYDLDISWIRLNHRGFCFGYRLELAAGAGSVVYITDHEIDATESQHASFESVVEFCAGAHILIHDAQYTRAEMEVKSGWGHSSVERVCEMAAEADVGRLILCHHDPGRSDDALDMLVEQANSHLAGLGSRLICEAAFEGMEVSLQPK